MPVPSHVLHVTAVEGPIRLVRHLLKANVVASCEHTCKQDYHVMSGNIQVINNNRGIKAVGDDHVRRHDRARLYLIARSGIDHAWRRAVCSPALRLTAHCCRLKGSSLVMPLKAAPALTAAHG